MRTARAVAGLLVALVVATAWWTPPPAVAVDAAPTEPVTIAVEATRDISVSQATPWVDAFVDSQTTLQYRSVSSSRARDHLLAGLVDAAIIGTPYTEEERAASKIGGTIEVPLHVSAAMILLSEPLTQRFTQLVQVTPEQDPDCDPQGADYDPAKCETRTVLTGPIRIPNANLAAMMLEVHADGLDRWQHPAVKAALEAPNLAVPTAYDAPTFVHREPGESVNRHIQQYVATAAPEVWELAKLANPGVPYDIDESLPGTLTTRSTPSSQGQQVGIWYNDPKTGGGHAGWYGNMADIPPSVFSEVKTVYPDGSYKVVQIKNASGEWVEPTPASISAAVAAGGAKPLNALTTPAAGAYPLVWVDQLSVPNSGLSAEKANAVAGFIRYVATRGQEGAAPLGEGRLSDSLVQDALRGADAIVEANCKGADVQLVASGDVGPYAPAALAEAGIASMKHCERTGPPEAAGGDPSPGATAAVMPFGPSDSGLSSLAGSAPSSSPASLTGGTASGTGGAAGSGASLTAGGGAAPPARPPVNLPFGVLASSRPGLDRVMTILFGAALFFLVRATIWPRLRKALGS